MPRGPADEEALNADIIALASRYGRYGYRRIAILLRDAGWAVNVKRIERIWRREGLKVPAKQPKKSRLWLNDGSCIRLRPERPNHIWSYDFVETRTHDGRKFRMLNFIDEFSRECLAIRIEAPPVSWTPDDFERKVSSCREPDSRTLRLSGSKSWPCIGPDAASTTSRRSSSLAPRPSTPG